MENELEKMLEGRLLASNVNQLPEDRKTPLDNHPADSSQGFSPQKDGHLEDDILPAVKDLTGELRNKMEEIERKEHALLDRMFETKEFEESGKPGHKAQSTNTSDSLSNSQQGTDISNGVGSTWGRM